MSHPPLRQQQPTPAGITARQLHRRGKRLQQLAYAMPELDDDTPRHFNDGSLSWTDLIGHR